MTPRPCAREQDVLALVSIGQWPRQADVDLLAHLSTCVSCAETVAVAAALHELDRDEALPVLPDARVVWQRAQWQARQDAVARAGRPVAAMQTVAALVTLLATIGVLAWMSDTFAAGDRLTAFARAVWASAVSVGTTAVTVVDAVTFSFQVPADVMWLTAGAIGFVLTAIGVAVTLSTLADLGREGAGVPRGPAGPMGPLGPGGPSGPS